MYYQGLILNVNPEVVDIPPPGVDYLLQEDLFFLLQEDGSKIIL